MDTTVSFDLFQSSYALWMPVIVLITFTLVMVPSLLHAGAKAEEVAKAIACYVMKTVGLALMAVSILPITMNLVNSTPPPMDTVMALILVFVIGMGPVDSVGP